MTNDIDVYLEEVRDRVAHNIAYAFLCGPPTVALVEAIEYDIKELDKYEAEIKKD